MTEVAVSFKNITKTFGDIAANRDVTFDVAKGEILALLGENGSGKTTLMNMLSGIYFPDRGSIEVNGKEVVIRSPKDAFELGIGMVHQHFKLVDVFSAVENTVLGLSRRQEKYNLKAAARKMQQICDKYGFEIDPKKKIYNMSVSEKQTLEIIKVLYRGADILILDEPTAVLTPQETEKLFGVLRNMREDGKSIIIITHKLNEVMEISDRVAVLRKGEYIGTVSTSETDEHARQIQQLNETNQALTKSNEELAESNQQLKKDVQTIKGQYREFKERAEENEAELLDKFEDESKVPTTVFSMGMGFIDMVDTVLLTSSGIDNSCSLRDCLEQGISNSSPLSKLQKHSDVTVIADYESSLRLSSQTVFMKIEKNIK